MGVITGLLVVALVIGHTGASVQFTKTRLEEEEEEEVDDEEEEKTEVLVRYIYRHPSLVSIATPGPEAANSGINKAFDTFSCAFSLVILRVRASNKLQRKIIRSGLKTLNSVGR